VRAKKWKKGESDFRMHDAFWATLIQWALRRNSTECPIGVGFRDSGFRLQSEVFGASACRRRAVQRPDETAVLPDREPLLHHVGPARKSLEVFHSMKIDRFYFRRRPVSRPPIA
jgi:hypothetical protein